jgi:Undecaprenyl-phosphate galactose phosphotransferase WbaP
MCSILVAVDFLSIFFSFFVATLLWYWIKLDIIFSDYLILIPFFLLFIIAFAMSDLYPTIGQNPITQFRSINIATTVVFLILAAFSLVVQHINVYSRAVFLISWVLCLLIIPTMRRSTIRFLCKKNMWGDPVIIIGLNNRTADLVQLLGTNLEYGFVPKIIFNFSDLENGGNSFSGIPVLKMPKDFNIMNFGEYSNIHTAIVIGSDLDQEMIDHFLKEGYFYFPRIILIPEKQLGSLWVTPLDIGGVLGFEIRQNLLNTNHQIIKRVVDLLIVIVISPVIILVGVLIALAIKFDSAGSVFFLEKRIGHNGNYFSVWKFRTMVTNANVLLEKYLKANPDLAEEWEKTRKVKNDPRITRVGKFLRRFSLDELPQLINIVRNEMSLIGPRPIVDEEVCKYGEQFKLYKQVKPGLSGLWQVSGRNDLSYDTRVYLDEYYVRNYSIWLDLYIIRYTIDALITSRGAY